jgi:spore germination cell wall hydrolase CwlJ-like protein
MTWDGFNLSVTALCLWREARGEGTDGMQAVAHVIANRAKSSGKSWAQTVYAKLQFSSMTYGQDPQLCNVPSSSDPQFAECCAIVDAVAAGTDSDLTNGATNYFDNSIPEPIWAKAMIQVAVIGRFTFYKEV